MNRENLPQSSNSKHTSFYPSNAPCKYQTEDSEDLMVNLNKLIRTAISALTKQYGKHIHIYREDMISEGWCIALECLQRFNPMYKVKLYTYIWPNVRHSLSHWLVKQIRWNQIIHEYIDFRRDTETMFIDSDRWQLQSNPYSNSPDIAYEKKELLSKLKEIRPDSLSYLETYFSAPHPQAAPHQRRARSRRRAAAIKHLRTAWQTKYGQNPAEGSEY